MSKVINFFDRVSEDYHHNSIFRAYGRFKQRHHRIQTEIERMRQSGCLESEIQEVISEYHASSNKPQLSLSECRELGIDVDGDKVTPLNRPRRESCP